VKLNFSEIENWKEFENLVADYFKNIQRNPDNQIIEVTVEPSGEGSDGGRDILVTFRMFDSIIIYQRKWIIQCKFHKNNVSKTHLSNVNIPSIIHEFGADGYLLVCKSGVTSKVSEMFENLRRNCKFGYDYIIWNGNDFLQLIKSQPNLIEHYFPKYFQAKIRHK